MSRDAPLDPYIPQQGGIAARARAMATGGARYLEGLNPEQRDAVETLDGPLLILAGAGTGKTRVLTTRIAHLLATGKARAHEILAVTFTNKAAREMKHRLGVLAGPAAEGMPWLGTFHAIGTKILRRHAELVGLRSDFTILDTDDQIRLLKQVLQAEGIDDKRWPARQLAYLIDAWKNRGLTPDKVQAGEASAFANGKAGKLYKNYQERLKILNAVDFGDLLVEGLRLLRENPDVLKMYQDRFKYMMVDEYQDTNVVQYLWLKLLAMPKQNLCCVGDDDQCLVEGTQVTLADGSRKAIEQISVGDAVLAAHGSGDYRAAQVLRVHRHAHTAARVRITLTSGKELVSTPEHVHFAGYRGGLTPQMHFTYLMHKRGIGFRLGTTQVYTMGQKQQTLGHLQRSVQEHADALWVLSTHDSESEARFEEMRLALKFGVPMLPFTPRKGKGVNGLVHDSALITRLHEAVGSEEAGRRLLEAHGLSIAEPHHQPQSRNASRRNVTVTLCGDKRGATPMHRLSLVGNDAEGAEILRGLGFSVRSVKAGSKSWRVETAHSSWAEIALIVERLRGAFEINLVRNARFGGDNEDGAKASASLPFIRAGSVRRGMAMFTPDGYEIVDKVETFEAQGAVYDLDIAGCHNFIANGIVTHNSIYGWRGAEVDNILRFEHEFKGAKVIKLERNYRSTGHILGAAAHLITNNDGRLGKTLFTDDEAGEKVTVTGVWDSEEEARIVGEEVEQQQRRGHSLDEIAVLVRASFQMREFEERFITLGLPYRVIGGPRFYERAEIRDALAYMRMVAQPADDLAFERIINVPKRGLGDATLQVLHTYARAQGVPMLQAARVLCETEELKPKPRQTLRDLCQAFARWSGQIETMKQNELAELVLEESGYTDMWKNDKAPDAPSRLENLKELCRSMEDFQDLGAFLEHVSLVMDVEQGESGPKVSIMTLHGAKGLEFETVFLPGWEEALFPHQRSLDESGRAGLEEERRLAYVGITRAKRRAKISFATNRRIHGLWQVTIPSRFLDELPPAHVEVVEAPGAQNFGGYGQSRFDRTNSFSSGYTTPGWQRGQARQASTGQATGRGGDVSSLRRGPPQIELRPAASSYAPQASGFAVGMRVFHMKFGPGAVAGIDGNKLTIDFDKAGRKTVLDSFVEKR